MRDAPPALIAGPYRTPPLRPGRPAHCARLGSVVVAGLTDGPTATGRGAPLSWPYAEGVGRKRSLLLVGDLVRAVRTESERAVAAAWGVSRATVGRWRRALGVGRMTEGTRRLWVELVGVRIGPEGRREGGRRAARARRARRGAQHGSA